MGGSEREIKINEITLNIFLHQMINSKTHDSPLVSGLIRLDRYFNPLNTGLYQYLDVL